MAFTPPTHGVAALHEALAQFTEEGGQPARLARYHDNCAVLAQGLSALRLRPFLPPSLQAPVIVTFHAPAHPAWRFQALYEATRRRGFILCPWHQCWPAGMRHASHGRSAAPMPCARC